jgi:hypothetical protein
MTRYGFPERALRALLFTSAIAVASGAWMSLPEARPSDRQQPAVIVRINNVGLEQQKAGDSVRVIVYSAGPARVGVGDAAPTPLTDTLRLSSLPAITADVADADVHIRLLTPGRMRLSAEVSGGRALRFTATGRHVVVLKGGVGADTITDP